mmetsp:Transcript_9160/g.26758  ORF Transcript_9160/g.26758 Transcript_9160/m.26758 type:complete len:214 (+) Transcript_9160:465-1106(+)
MRSWDASTMMPRRPLKLVLNAHPTSFTSVPTGSGSSDAAADGLWASARERNSRIILLIFSKSFSTAFIAYSIEWPLLLIGIPLHVSRTSLFSWFFFSSSDDTALSNLSRSATSSPSLPTGAAVDRACSNSAFNRLSSATVSCSLASARRSLSEACPSSTSIAAFLSASYSNSVFMALLRSTSSRSSRFFKSIVFCACFSAVCSSKLVAYHRAR